jgi:hypothetical protein
LKNIRRPAAVLVGSADEQNVADQFEPLFQNLGVKIPVTIVLGMTHVDMIATPTALQAVVARFRRKHSLPGHSDTPYPLVTPTILSDSVFRNECGARGC